MSTAGEAKLREWAMRQLHKQAFADTHSQELDIAIEAGRDLICQCAEIARNGDLGCDECHGCGHAIERAILREFGMEER